MSLLSYLELIDLQHKSIITNSRREHVNSASIDVTLGPELLVEHVDTAHAEVLCLRKRQPLRTKAVNLIVNNGYVLQPGEFVLAQSEQVFNLPNWLSAEYKLKSSMARIGLEHLTAGWADAGWNGSVLTLELKNMTRGHAIKLHHGDRIGQIVFFRHAEVPEWASYAGRGRYNGDLTVKGIKP